MQVQRLDEVGQIPAERADLPAARAVGERKRVGPKPRRYGRYTRQPAWCRPGSTASQQWMSSGQPWTATTVCPRAGPLTS
ncbi:hypothetical protein ACIBJF_49135 [Streptomyces sp. NPDC050743]|uniref:hypothetical protein n=1 Tax=Streptomyces sp. NPDC050743 TaxID=3365634 RepID=UPI00379BCCD8